VHLAEEKERAEKRAKFGEEVVAKTNMALGARLTLDAFDVKAKLPVDFARKPSFADCSGLVAAHISEKRAQEIVDCCDAALGQLRGALGFDEYGFVGIAQVSSTTLAKLLDAAKALHDSVLFCPDKSDSIVLIDHYRVSGIPRDVGFSVVVQGEDLEGKLAKCFENVIRLELTAR
jgi:hypothetical protein